MSHSPKRPCSCQCRLVALTLGDLCYVLECYPYLLTNCPWHSQLLNQCPKFTQTSPAGSDSRGLRPQSGVCSYSGREAAASTHSYTFTGERLNTGMWMVLCLASESAAAGWSDTLIRIGNFCVTCGYLWWVFTVPSCQSPLGYYSDF